MQPTVVVYGHRKGSVVAGAVWMLVISLLLFWLPVFGALIAGIVGGKRAGGLGPAIAAVFLPAIVLGTFFFVFGTALTGFPLVGALAGGGVFSILALGAFGPLLVGAIIGGILT